MRKRLSFAAGMAFAGIPIVLGRSDYFVAAELAIVCALLLYLASDRFQGGARP